MRFFVCLSYDHAWLASNQHYLKRHGFSETLCVKRNPQICLGAGQPIASHNPAARLIMILDDQGQNLLWDRMPRATNNRIFGKYRLYDACPTSSESSGGEQLLQSAKN
jgi:hypothetical protein